MKKVIVLIAVLGFYCTSHAQDPHYTQLFGTPLLLSPTLTGLSNYEGELTLQYRNERNTLDAPFQTVSLTYERSFPVSNRNSFVGVGLSLLNDQAGNIYLRNTQLQLAVAYHEGIGEHSFLSAGVQLGGGQNSARGPFQTTDVFVPRFFGSDVENISLLSDQNQNYVDLGAGVAYTYTNNGTFINVGVSGLHLNTPEASFQEANDETLEAKIVGHANVEIPFKERFAFIIRGAYISQNNNDQINVGGLIKYYLNDDPQFDPDEDVFVTLGVMFRENEAFAPILKWHQRRVGIGISFDIYNGQNELATSTNNSFEMVVHLSMNEPVSDHYIPPFH